MSEDWMPEEIEKRELTFNHKQELYNRIEELLGQDEKLVQLYYQIALARQLEDELYHYLIPRMGLSSGWQGGKFISKAKCSIYFQNKGEQRPCVMDNNNVKETAIEMADYLEEIAKSLTVQAEEIRQKITAIPQIKGERKNIKKVQLAIKQAEKELFKPYAEKLQEICKRIVEKQKEKS